MTRRPLATEPLEDRSVPVVLPAGFSESVFAAGLTNPTQMAEAPEGRVFVAEQGGALRVIHNGTLLPTPFVSLTVEPAGERGLIGVALDPNFETNGFVYLYAPLLLEPLPSSPTLLPQWKRRGKPDTAARFLDQTSSPRTQNSELRTQTVVLDSGPVIHDHLYQQPATLPGNTSSPARLTALPSPKPTGVSP